MVIKKILIAMLGGTNAMFSIFIPIGLALLLTPFVDGFTEVALLIIAILSTMYRAIDIGFLGEEKWEKNQNNQNKKKKN